MVRNENTIIPIPEKKLKIRVTNDPFKVKVLFMADSFFSPFFMNNSG